MIVDIILVDENMISFNEFINFDYKINSSDNNEILLGNCSAASLNFSVWNAEKRYSTFRFKKGTCFLYRDEERTEKIGTFKVDKITNNRNTLEFECTDYMTKLDELFKGIEAPFNTYKLLNQICSQLDIELRNTADDFKHLNQIYISADSLVGKKCRDVLKWIGEISCKYCIFDEEGKLFLNWYDLETIRKEIPYNKLKEFSRDEEELQITGVSILIDKEEELVGTNEGYDLRLTKDNPLLKELTGNQRQYILKDIYNKVYGMNYLSCDIALSVDDEIKIGDTLKVYDEYGEVFKIIVSYININKLWSMKITSAGENLNRDISNGSSSGDNQGSKDKTYIAKDENFKEINLKGFVGETFLNSLTIFGVSENSSAFLSYSLEFDIDVEIDLKFNILVNDILSKQITYKTKIGKNIFNWSEKANIQVDSENNVFKFVLNTLDVSTSYVFKVEKEKSILNVISVGASSGSNIVTSLEFTEDVKSVVLTNKFNNITLKSFDDTIRILLQEYIYKEATDKVDLIDFKIRKRFNLDNNINELVVRSE